MRHSGDRHYILDARTATPHFPGIGRYVVNLARAMVTCLLPGERLTVLHDPAHPPDLPHHPRVTRRPVAVSPFALRQQWAMPRLLRGMAPTLYHSTYYLMPYWYPDVPTVLTLYDVIPLRFPSLSTYRARFLFRWMMALALRVTDLALPISEASARDFQTHFRLPTARLRTVPLAADPLFRPQPRRIVETLRRRYNLPTRFLLYLGSNKPHKNLVRLVEAHAHLPPTERVPLVIAGAWYPAFPEARRRAERLGTPVRWLGPVPGEALPALYAAATAFIFPSLYEGFGLPPLEAMACGTPVACSNTSSLPEVVGEAALTFDPTCVEDIADAIRRLLDDKTLRATLRERGLHRAAHFSWARTARLTLEAYRSLLN